MCGVFWDINTSTVSNWKWAWSHEPHWDLNINKPLWIISVDGGLAFKPESGWISQNMTCGKPLCEFSWIEVNKYLFTTDGHCDRSQKWSQSTLRFYCYRLQECMCRIPKGSMMTVSPNCSSQHEMKVVSLEAHFIGTLPETFHFSTNSLEFFYPLNDRCCKSFNILILHSFVHFLRFLHFKNLFPLQ